MSKYKTKKQIRARRINIQNKRKRKSEFIKNLLFNNYRSESIREPIQFPEDTTEETMAEQLQMEHERREILFRQWYFNSVTGLQYFHHAEYRKIIKLSCFWCNTLFYTTMEDRDFKCPFCNRFDHDHNHDILDLVT